MALTSKENRGYLVRCLSYTNRKILIVIYEAFNLISKMKRFNVFTQPYSSNRNLIVCSLRTLFYISFICIYLNDFYSYI